MSGRFDKIDLALIDALRKDPRATNKTLARAVGIAETTVALRIRQMRDDEAMIVTLRRDLYERGFDLQCFADITVKGRDIDAVADELANKDVMTSVSVLLGTPQIVVVFNAANRADLLRVLEEEIGRVRGVDRIELHTAVDIRKYQSGYTHLPGYESALRESHA
jgi:DNA-binding Lrp family transcriptional regulator